MVLHKPHLTNPQLECLAGMDCILNFVPKFDVYAIYLNIRKCVIYEIM